jgi:hypothetical protein
VKKKKVKATDGTVYTEYSPENDADIEELNKMLRAGTLSPPFDWRTKVSPAAPSS